MAGVLELVTLRQMCESLVKMVESILVIDVRNVLRFIWTGRERDSLETHRKETDEKERDKKRKRERA